MQWIRSPETCTIVCTATPRPSRIESGEGSEDTMALCHLRVTRGPSSSHRTRQYLQTMMNAQSAGHHGEVERFQLRRGGMDRVRYTVRTPQEGRGPRGPRGLFGMRETAAVGWP